MRRGTAVWGAILVLLAFLCPGNAAAQEPRLVDRIVAVVNGEVLTLGQLNRAVQRVSDDLADGRGNCVIQQLGDTAASTASDEIERRTLQCMIDELLMFQHVRRFPQFDVLPADIERAYLNQVSRFESRREFEEALSAQGVTPAEVRYDIERDALVANYIEVRYRRVVQISAREVDRYYEEVLRPEMESRGAPLPAIEAVSGMIEAILAEEEVAGRIEAWISDLRRRANVVVFLW